MGSNGSTPHNETNAQKTKQHRAEAEKIQRDNEKREAERRRLHEQYWKDFHLREEQKRKEAEQQEWQRQADLRMLRMQQQQIQKELAEQKELRKLDQEQLQKQREEQRVLQAHLEEQRLRKAELEEQRQLLLKVQSYQQHFQPIPTAPVPDASPSAPSVRRETVALQQRASTAVESYQLEESGADFLRDKSTNGKKKEKKWQPPKQAPESYLQRMSNSKVKYFEWSIIDYIQDENLISETVTVNVMNLLDDKNTIPFIARYRRHLTQGMEAEKLRKVQNSYEQAKLIKQRAISIIKDIQDKDQWTPELHALVHETKSLTNLDQINLILKTSKSKVAKMAAKAGLGVVAEACILKKKPPIPQLVRESVEGLKTEEQVKDAIASLMANIIVKDRRTFDIVKELRAKHQVEVKTVKHVGVGKLIKNANEYEAYYDFSLLENELRPDQVFAINRGEALKALRVWIKIPDEFEREFREQCLQQFGFTGAADSLKITLMKSAIDFAYNKLMKVSLVKRIRREINDRARITVVQNLEQNVKQALLAPPVRGKVVIGIKPGFQEGCKLAVVSERGHLLRTKTIYPHAENNPQCNIDAERTLVQLICRHKCTVLALGTGIAAKETEIFLAHVMKNKKVPSDVFYTYVDSTGASIYSRTREAALEFPQVDADIVSAASIARRLQDPMSELVKIGPELLTAEIYQHDIPENQSATKMINDVIVDTVSHVGVDVNTAHVVLLKKVAGLDEAKANNIIEWRRSHGPIVNRNDLLKISGINKRVFEQCAGFLRIVPETVAAISGQEVSQDSLSYFDQTWVHPESYNVAKSFLDPQNLTFTVNIHSLSAYAVWAKKFGTIAETIEMIVQGLRIEKGQDIRGEANSSIFRRSFVRYNDLINGQVLTGVVTHLAAFGAFVDVGAEVDGLIHKKCMNGLTVAVAQKVEVRVSNIEKERGRLGLTLIRCI